MPSSRRNLPDRKPIEDALRFLAQCGVAPGDDFFHLLADYLARSLGVDYVCIDRLEEDSLTAQTVAIYFDGKFEENVSYALKGTPCGDVVKDKICCFPQGVRRLFPNDQVLQDMQAESYVGTVLWGSQGQSIGLIAVLGRKPLENPELAVAILQLAAVRAAGELERRQAEEALRYAVDELSRSNQDLEAFAYLASHDLQSPLRIVTGMLNLLRERYQGQLDAKADECLNFALAGAKQMSELINDLLTYSRVGNKELEVQSINLQEPVYRALKLLRPALDASGAKIAVPADLPKVQAHPGELAQVFENLIGNAVKFRSERPPEIEVGAKRDEDQWLVWVKDNGIGLDPKQADLAFELFRRLHDRSKYPGTGIGLAICKKIVERHDGRIWVESEPGKGSTFFFTLASR
jgi:signal transduction histidine kinase